MEVSNFFTRLLQAPKETAKVKQVDDLGVFDAAWTSIRETLEQPDERQIVRGISSTQVPAQLRRIVDALVYESNRTDEDTTGACLEYFLKNDLLSQLERLCEPDRPHGIKAEVLRAINNLIVSLSERFLVHNAVHRPLRRLLRSCVGEEPEEKIDGSARVVGAAGMSPAMERRASNDDIEEELVNLMCTLASRMVAYPPLLLIFFHDKGWLVPPNHPSRTPSALERALSPTPSGYTGQSEPSARNSVSAKTTHHFEFLLFSYLLRFVHREGQIGDPARAGLLFLFDIAFLPPSEQVNSSPQFDNASSDPLQDARDAFGEFILDGDFAEVMAAGLGAIYSLLPSKLHVPSLSVIADSDEEQQASASGGMHLGAGLEKTEIDIPSSTDGDVRIQLDLILKLFGFLQDIIHRCNSPIHHSSPGNTSISPAHILGSAISDATLDAIQSSFLDNVLYPSVLECSSHDGSAVAVLTYLDVIFSNLDDGPLLNRMLTFLMDTQQSDGPNPTGLTKKAKRKTGAMGFVQQPIHTADYFADEGRFTLKDLILDNLHSSDWTASTAALRLLRSLLGDHCSHSVRGLLSVIRDPAATALARRPIPRDLDSSFGDSFLPPPVNSTDMHLQEIELYSSLITRIDPLQPPLELAAGYAVYLTDMQAALEAERCYRLSQIPLQFLGEDEKKSLLGAGLVEEPIQHRLSPSDPVIGAILDLLASFLGNTPDENVALTGAVTTIAMCPHRSLVGWLLYDVKTETDPWAAGPKSPRPKPSSPDDVFDPISDSDSDSDINIDAGPSSHAADPFTARASVDLPAVYQILRELVKTISGFRSSIDSFDRLLSERRQGLLFADHLDEAMNLMLDVDTSAFGLPSTPTQAKKPKRPSAVGLASSLKSFLTPKRKGTPTTPASGSNAERSTPRLGGLFGSSSNSNAATASGSTSTPDKTSNALSQPPSSYELSRSSLLFAAANGNGNGVSLSGPVTSDGSVSPSPFMAHYEQASTSLDVNQSQSSAVIASGPWSPASNPIAAAGRFETPILGAGDHSVGSMSITGGLEPTSLSADTLGTDPAEGEVGQVEGEPRMRNYQTKVKLSVILDNCVILEEFIKELVAVITARRAMGIDQVGYI
ncbi:hypothetical protein I317_04133 [Kwoniella heveanensis CBS 569]|uniref:Retinoic acid induced 16-like protein-domain-containing protein n=1 Tax=Kwoniella heveanensis BCC8398 TaxID=1296120 RepID=A0A1B9GQV7_9TREE|nr:hypothetical protein I316_04870 [Kwoniella heveanensis BCC8398]OCF42047.1 hypothetical protein I317_04133 [Kwoniella heveanensis CBS 569]